MKTKSQSEFYWIKSNTDGICVLCNSKIHYCHVGEYCSNNECPYVDGMASLDADQAEKFKEYILQNVTI
jgi:hypothetical protein